MVTPSPWPLAVSFWSFFFVISFLHFLYTTKPFFFFYSFLGLCFFIGLWSRDVIREATFEGKHTLKVQRGLKFGFILFIVSEIMFFFSFFWAYFHSSLAPGVEIGCTWPPAGIVTFDAWGIPLLNTYILLLSGATITACHHYIVAGSKIRSIVSILLTLCLAASFTFLQFFEYKNAPFSIYDGIYGSVFYLLTGFHGMHVILGSLLIFFCFLRLLFNHFTRTHHIGFESSAWYWHFVDVVWLFLFIIVYWWGS